MSAPTHRRGKKDNLQPAPQTADSVMEQLRRAQAALEQNRAGTLLIHQQWRSTLTRFAVVLLGVTLYQAMFPARQCYADVQDLPLEQQLQALFMDGAMFVVALVESILLTLYLVLVTDSNLWHVLLLGAHACLPLLLMVRYWQRTTNLHGSCRAFVLLDTSMEAVTDRSRTFPVVVVFHFLTLICTAFMSFQQQQMNKNLETVRNMREEVLMKQRGVTTTEGGEEDDEDEEEEEEGGTSSGRRKFKKKRGKQKNTKKRR